MRHWIHAALALLLPALSVAAGSSSRASLPQLKPRIPGAPKVVSDYARMTGALYRAVEDPGPIKRMWVVYKSQDELERVAEAVDKIKAANPGVEVYSLDEKDVVPTAKNEDGEEGPDKSAAGRQKIFEHILRERVDFVLATNQDIYEHFRGLRDANLARNIPFGFAGRKYVSVDIPRASLDPEKLSDPTAYPARRYLWIGARGSENVADGVKSGMERMTRSLKQVLESTIGDGHGAAKGDEDMSFVQRQGAKYMMKLAGQADDGRTAKLREQAHHLAAYIDQEKIDLLATDDPVTSQVLGIMKKMGYHKSLPVVWAADEKPADASAVTMAVMHAPWESEAPHVQVSPTPKLSVALRAAVKAPRIPDNFMEMGGVTVKDFEQVVHDAVAKAVPGQRPKGVHDVHFLLTNGNGVKTPGDGNPFGHFGMAISDERGKLQAWTVSYNDGGSFTGGLGDGKQLSLGEYLYGSLWYLPGAMGQAIPLAETAAAPVYDFILRGVDEAQLERMRRKAAEINAKHLRGQDNYKFLNQLGMTNCISMVTQILRAAGFRIPETTIQDPAGQAVNMFAELARWLLNSRINADQFGLVVWERPAHAGPEHYRIPNTALASPLFTRRKPWERMTIWEKSWRVLTIVGNTAKALAVPRALDAFAALASHRVVVGPNSREAAIVENPKSPVLKLRNGVELIKRFKRRQVDIMEDLQGLEAAIIKTIGFDGWAPNPAQSLREQAKGRSERLEPGARAELEQRLERHHDLTVELQLSQIDEIIEERRMMVETLRLADPMGKYLSKVNDLWTDYKKVKDYRERVVVQDRVLTDKEKLELDVLNARLEGRLEQARQELLKRLGPSVPQSVEMMLGQVSREALEELKAMGGGDGKKGKKGAGKK